MIGSALQQHWIRAGHSITSLVRLNSKNVTPPHSIIYWNPPTEEIHLAEWENFDAVVHLAGDNISSQRWTPEKKKEIFLSRSRDTRLLSDILCQLKRPPSTLFCASAVGYYGNRGNEVLTEESPSGEGFLAETCIQWETATEAATQKGIRVIHGRFGNVLSLRGGMLQKIRPIFTLGLGAKLGNGQQWMSWIALQDLIYAVDFLLEHISLAGVFNLTSPQPIRNETFTNSYAAFLHRPALFSLPANVLKLLLGEMAQELLLSSTRALPKRLSESGFQFSLPSIEQALLAQQ